MTFAFGLASVWFINNKEFVDNSIMNEESEMKNSTIIYVQPRFVKTSDISYSRRSVSIYVSSNGQEVRSGNISSFDGNGLNRRIRQAKKIIEGKDGRFVLEFQDKREHHFEILQYVVDNSYDFIHAPTLELALEFEEVMTCKGG